MGAVRAQAGFTLLELIVALTLGGLAFALVGGSIWSAVETRVRQTARVDADHRARVTREFLREAVRGLAVERAGREPVLALDPGRDPWLRLHTRGGAVFGWEPELKRVEIGVDRDSGTRQTGLVARVARDGAEDTLVLLPEATGLGIRLLDGSGTWRTEWADPTLAPAAVEFGVAGGDGRLQVLPLQVRVP